MTATDGDEEMCPVCFDILEDDGTCPHADDHGTDLLAIWQERNEQED